MANNEKFLQPLKVICLKIEKSEDVHQNIANLKKYIKKGSFYEYYSFIELLDVLARNLILPAETLTEIFTILASILRDGTNNKDAIIGRCYNFIIEHKNRLNLINEFISIFKFKEELTTQKSDVLLLISEVLLRLAQTSCQRQLLYGNYRSFIEKHATKFDFCLKYVQSINRTVNCFVISKKLESASEFLEVTLLQPLTDKSIPPPDNDIFIELFSLFSFIAKYCHADRSLMEVSKNITKELQNLLNHEHYKSCNDILMRIFRMCHMSSFDESNLKEIYMIYRQHQKLTQVDFPHQKTAILISKLFANKLHIFELTPSCFSTFHLLSVSLFHIFKTIKNEEGVVSCCSDIKRHEVLNLINIVLSLACKLAATGEFTPSNSKHLLYHIKYVMTICSEIKCKSKPKEMLSSYSRLFNLVYEFNSNKGLISENISYLHEYLKTLYNLWNQLSDELKATGTAPDALALEVYKSPLDKQTAFYSANGIASIMMRYRKLADDDQDPKMRKKILMKYVCAMRVATKVLGFSKATDFVKSKKFSDAGFADDTQKISLAEFIYFEMGAIFRYSPGEDFSIIGQLFTELCSLTKDPVLLAQSSQMISDATLKVVGTSDIKKLNKLLEEARKKEFDMEISLALALNNYSLYFEMAEAVASDLKENLNITIEKLELQKELTLLQYLNESLTHFTDVVSHLMQNKNDMCLVQSTKRVLTILNNIALQYYIRGIKFKDLEAFSLLWHLTQIEDQSVTIILNIGTFFLDNFEQAINLSGNYIKITKKVKQLTVEEILGKLNRILEEQCVPMFESLPEAAQCYVLSFLLSSWVYYLSRGHRSEGFSQYDQFKKLWWVVEKNSDSVNREAIRSKLYFCLVEINMNCCNKSADNFLSMANGILMSVKTIDRDFSNQFQQIYYRVTLKAVNYSINRLSDMNQYDTVMASLILMASKKGNCLKVLDLLSLSILRSLNMEKAERAKSQLKEITKILGLKEEILIEAPTKFQAPVKVLNYDLHDQTVRKAAVASSSIQCELSMIYEDSSSEMSLLLESFLHKARCVCEICKIPQVKFFLFQIGCHYSRLMWMMNKFDVSAAFNHFAIGTWRDFCDKLRRTMDNDFMMINKTDFAVFSIRWLFQCADTLIKLEKFDEIEQIYLEIELILISSLPDFKCVKQALHCRRENLNFIIEQEMNEKKEALIAELSFEAFLKFKENVKLLERSQKSPVPTMLVQRPEASAKNSSNMSEAAIYIDSSQNTFIDSKIGKKNFKAVKQPEPIVTPQLSSNLIIAKIDIGAIPGPSISKEMSNQTPKPKTTSRLRPEKTSKQSATKVIGTIDLTDDLSVATRRTRRKMI